MAEMEFWVKVVCDDRLVELTEAVVSEALSPVVEMFGGVVVDVVEKENA